MADIERIHGCLIIDGVYTSGEDVLDANGRRKPSLRGIALIALLRLLGLVHLPAGESNSIGTLRSVGTTALGPTMFVVDSNSSETGTDGSFGPRSSSALNSSSGMSRAGSSWAGRTWG